MKFRSLFLLHEIMLSFSHRSIVGAHNGAKDAAWTALDTVCELVIEVVRVISQSPPETMPLCCYYNLTSCRNHLRDRVKLFSDPTLSKFDIDKLANAAQAHQSGWSI